MGDIQLTIAPSFDLGNEVDGLRGKIGRMKGLALDIQHESRLNSEVLNSLEDTVAKARLNLKKTMRRIDRAFKFTGSSHILLLLVFPWASSRSSTYGRKSTPPPSLWASSRDWGGKPQRNRTKTH